MKPERNRPCLCGSGKKYKRCCGSALADGSAGATTSRFNARQTYRAALKRWEEIGGQFAPPPLYTAIESVHRFLFHQAEDPAFQGFFRAATQYTQILQRPEVPQNRIMEFVLPRIPFDLVSKPHGHPPAQDFLLRYGADLPAEAAGAVEALIEARDEFVEIHEREGEVSLERLADSADRVWANPVLVPPGTVLLGRLVEFEGFFSLFTPEEVSEVTRRNHLDAVRAFSRLEGLAWKRLGWNFRSPGKDLHFAYIFMKRAAEETSLDLRKGHAKAKKSRRRKG